MSDRDLVLEAVKEMPEQASFTQIVDELALLASVKKGMSQIERGEGLPHEQVVQRFNSWITKSSGLQKR